MQRTKQELAQFVVRSFREMGIRVNPSCRVMRQHDVFVKSNEDIEFGTSDFFLAVEALRDLQMLGFIFDQKNDVDDPAFRLLVNNCLSDQPLSDNDGHRTPGRDAQFELYVAAACKNAGLFPVEHSSPDVIFSIGNLKYCIEAKRPKSIAAIDGCLRDASAQIAKRGLPGFIAVETSIAFALERYTPPVPELDDVWERLRHLQIHLKPLPDLEFAKIHTSAMNFVIGKFRQAMDRRMEGKGVLGIVFDNQMTRIFSDGEWGLTGGSIRYQTSSGPEFDIVVDEFFRGLPGVDRNASS